MLRGTGLRPGKHVQLRLDSPSAPRSERWARPLLAVALVAGAAARVWLALHDDGIYWPDEIHQSLEPAHRWVFGYGLVAWEFVEGARNWALPGVVAGLLEGARRLGWDAPRQYLPLVKVFFAVLALGAVGGTYALARASGASAFASAVGAAMFAGSAPAIYFAPRAMSETASAVPAALGLAFGLWRPAAHSPSPGGAWVARHRGAFAGLLLGLAVLLRLQCAMFCVGLLVVLAVWRSRRVLLEAALCLALMAFLFGLLDHLTWAQAPGARFDGWFHSAIKYLQFNLIEGKSSGWGTSGPDFFARHLFTSMPWLMTVATGGVALAYRQARGLFWIAAAFLLLHTAIPHKELRFIYPMLPLWFALAAVGIDRLTGRPAAVALGLALAAATGSLARFHSLTFGDLGHYLDRRNVSAYDDAGPVNRLLLVAHDQPDLCGLRVDATHLAWSGGHSYLHREVPLYHLGRPALGSGLFNYLVTFARPQLPGEVIAQEGPLVLVRLRGECSRDAGYSWRLP